MLKHSFSGFFCLAAQSRLNRIEGYSKFQVPVPETKTYFYKKKYYITVCIMRMKTCWIMYVWLLELFDLTHFRLNL